MGSENRYCLLMSSLYLFHSPESDQNCSLPCGSLLQNGIVWGSHFADSSDSQVDLGWQLDADRAVVLVDLAALFALVIVSVVLLIVFVIVVVVVLLLLLILHI